MHPINETFFVTNRSSWKIKMIFPGINFLVPLSAVTFPITGTMQGHKNRVTCLAVAEAGHGIATSSWDANVRIWGI